MFNSSLVKRLVALALDEDIGMGDVTTQLCVKPTVRARAEVLARQDLVVCGLGILQTIVDEFDSSAEVECLFGDGEKVRRGAALARLRGSARDLLSLERTMLNFLQRLSGISTYTAKIARQAGALVLLDTRKTTPGWRLLEKYAVKMGGAANHRAHLGDMVLVKNNHIDANGGSIDKTLRSVMAGKPPYMKVEVEVRDLKELAAAIEHRPDIILLDNFSVANIRKALSMLARVECRPLVEVSGGVKPDSLRALNKLGVHYVSMGSLTTQATNVDISMQLSIGR